MPIPSQTVGLFPEPVSRYTVWSESWKPQLLSVNLEPVDRRHYADNHDYSHDDRVLDRWPTLNRTILDCCQQFANEVLGIRDPLRITQSWINRYRPGEYIHQHNHPNSLVSATWYWQLPETAEILFHRHALNSAHTWTMKFDRHGDSASGFAAQITSIRVEEGDLLIWPSYLVHSVPAWNHDEPRYSLSLNAMPEHWGSGLYRV